MYIEKISQRKSMEILHFIDSLRILKELFTKKNVYGIKNQEVLSFAGYFGY